MKMKIKIKKPFNYQLFQLPLIEQGTKPSYSKLSKDSSKRSIKSSKNSLDLHPKQKQKNFPKLSNFIPIK